jgi:cell division protein FtsI (penicillin-binding protein 3)
MNKFSVIVIIIISFFSCKKSNVLVLSPNIEKNLCESAYLNKSLKSDYTVTTFIDSTIQNLATKELLGVLEQFEAESGFVMIMETKTGQIKAMASLVEGEKLEFVNSKVIDATIPIEPGSLIKTFNMFSLLEDKKSDTSLVYNANGGEKIFYGVKIQDVKKGYESISLKRAFAISSNVVFAQAIDSAYRDNPNQYINNYKNFGLNQDLDLPFNSKISSTIPSPKSNTWSKIALPFMGIGYGLTLKPIQILTYFNAIGNNGVLIKPNFLSRITSSKDSRSKKYSTTILNNEIYFKATIKIIQYLLKNAVSTDSKKLQIAGQAAEITLDYAEPNKSRQVASTFVGYFSKNNSKYTMMVYIKKPKNRLKNHLNIAEKLFGELVEKI